MDYAPYRRPFLSNSERYLPYLYPILMPVFSLFASKMSVYTVQDMLKHWLSAGCLQLILLVLIQKIIYLKSFKQPVRWLIAGCIGSVVVYCYFLLNAIFPYLSVHSTNPNKLLFQMRAMLNIPLLIALLESIKSAAERKSITIDNMALENENAKAQFNLLLQQINPHFLFNCLTVLQAMVRSKDARTEEFIIKLTDVYHQTLKKEKGMVTLKEELDFFNAYMYLMTLRQEEAIFVEVRVPDASLAYHLPAFSLQLLAENCIKHNIVSTDKPLYIRLYQKEPKSLTISNNYQPKALKSESFNIGIQNLKNRYALDGIAQGVQIEQNEAIYETTIKLL